MKSVEGLRHYFCSILLSLLTFCTSEDIITTDQPITDGRTIVSAGGNFELGFFSPGSSKKRYIGIWYNSNIPTKDVVWVANRETPLNNTSGKLMLKDNGVLVLLDGSNEEMWSSNSSTSLKNPVARLLDTGNLVVREGNGNSAWQSFDYPGNTLLPGMKLGRNLATGHAWSLTSWKTADDHGKNALKLLWEYHVDSFIFTRTPD